MLSIIVAKAKNNVNLKIKNNSFDIEYMKDHNISEEEMKKIKSMMLFLSNKYPQEGKNNESNQFRLF